MKISGLQVVALVMFTAGMAFLFGALVGAHMEQGSLLDTVCQQQGYTSGTYQDGKVICEHVTRVELGK